MTAQSLEWWRRGADEISMGRGSWRSTAGGIALVAGLVIALAPPASAAPPGGGGTMSGQVTNSGGTPLPGVCVQIKGGAGTSTDSSGDYSFSGLPAGDYLLSFQDCAG